MKRTTLLLTLIVALLSGCQSVSSFYRGKTVAAEQVIPIAGTAKGEEWKTFDLTINFDYGEEGEFFAIGGEVALSEHYRMNYEWLRDLDILLLFIDNRLQVIEAAYLVRGGGHGTDATMPFSLKLPIPEQAAAFSFAYEGFAIAGDDKPGSPSFFWLRPK